MSLEPTAPRPAPAFTADEERPITGRPFLVPLYVPHFTARSHQSVEDRMRFVIELSRLNVDHGTGGPFGAAIFDRETGTLLAPGVNLVLSAGCSAAHAEMVAIMVAQQLVGDFDLSGEGLPPYQLVASTEPCAMCLGATPCSGVRSLVCGARGGDAESIGSDEGTKPPEWVRSLEERGITVVRDVCREEAISVLRQYAEGGVVRFTTAVRADSLLAPRAGTPSGSS